jgi:sulfotransferase family protein
MISHKPILVTGSPRSGTSWVGRIIGHVPFVRYIHEPLNIHRNPCHCGVKFKYWFFYLSPGNLPEFEDHLKHIMYPAYSRVGLINLITEIMKSRRIRPLSKYLQAYRFHRLLVKDPIAVFSAETLESMFDMEVLVLIRHPAAMVNSYKALHWTNSFSHFLQQPELMEEHLAPFQAEIEDFVKNDHDIVDQAALLWKLIHNMILKYQKIHPDWSFVRFEDLASAPIEGYQNLFNRLELPFSDNIRSVIEAHSFQPQPSDTTRPYSIKQDSSQVISKWKKHLTPGEVMRIRKRVEEVSSHFFSQNEWCIFLAVLLWFIG